MNAIGGIILAVFIIVNIAGAKPVEDGICAEYDDRYLNFTQLCNKYGYPVERYSMQTSDGYILQMFRIRKYKVKRPPVLLMHGLLGSATDFILNLNTSLGFQLADQGYDVWLGNARGTVYSNKHISMNNKMPNYWNFSFDEVGMHDLPAFIDCIRYETGYKQIYYIAHSQGATEFFVMNSLRSEYRSAVRAAFLLSPVAYLAHMPAALKTAAFIGYHWNISAELLFDESTIDIDKYRKKCDRNTLLPSLCSTMMFLFYGKGDWYNCRDLVYFAYVRAGAAFKMMQHFGQLSINERFFRFDYGVKNKNIYGQSYPPAYNLTAVEAPVVLMSAVNDAFTVEEDIQRTEAELGNVVAHVKITQKNFSHTDFVGGSTASTLVNSVILDMMPQYYYT